MDLEPGDIVEKYTIESLLGRGGMASVYRVQHNTLGTVHALKVLTVADRTIRERLLNEGRLQARLRHVNIVPVTDVLDVHGAPGLLMECVEGEPLDVWLSHERPTLEQAERIFGGILAGVERAHALGVTHRDLKPDNVLLDMTGDVPIPKVADFGIAKALDAQGSVHRTRQGLPMGTPAYMAPEQFRNAAMVDHRADIYSLSCILYELVCGKVAFAGNDFAEIFAAAMAGRYTPPHDLVPDLPDRVVAAIVGGLQVDRVARIPTCVVLRETLIGRRPTRPPARTPIATTTMSSWEIEAASSASGIDPADPTALPSAVPAALPSARRTSPSPSGETPPDPSVSGGVPTTPLHTWNRGSLPLTAPATGSSLPTLSPSDLSSSVAAEATAEEVQHTLPTVPSNDRPSRRGPVLLALAALAAVVGIGVVVWPDAPTSEGVTAEGAPLPDAPPTDAPVAVPPPADPAAPVVAPSVPPADAAPVATVTLTAPPQRPSSGTPATVAPATVRPATVPPATVAPTTPPEAAPPPPTVARARVSYEGASGLWLEADGVRVPAGSVPAGTYTIFASFNGGAAVAAGSVRLHAGDVVHVRCDGDFLQCRP